MKEASVIIPAKNEESTIARVIKTAKKVNLVDEVIVVDSHSTDRTAEEASRSGAKVIEQSSSRPGKGRALESGLKAASGDIAVFFDADIVNVAPSMFERLIRPVVEDKADFIKGMFDRKGGRVTELVAKPLLQMFFPKTTNFSQPLSGESASKRKILEEIKFEPSWGVDIGILLDIMKPNVRIREANLGFIKHVPRPLTYLQGMAYEVASAILRRAKAEGRWIQEEVVEMRETETGLEEALKDIQTGDRLAVR
ncbi:MAG: glycosyltransferase [Candidatus Hadarchaeota archaeon]|nr:glycosyltransferase [Candidatus Hadarchaeota archaeon]